MPTTRSGAHYGLETKRQAKGKVAVQTYAKAKPQPSKIKLSTVEVKQDAGKKRAVQYYKKPPVKASVTRVQKISKVQAAKRKESIDNRRFIGSPRVQPDGADYPVGYHKS